MWQRGGRGRGRGRNQGPWPGNGPFSHLPPWERPGWLYGPGSCWTLYQRGTTPSSNQSTKAVVPPSQGFPQVMFCTRCGTPLVSEAKYCHECGASVDKSR